jgi:hypothetical protein
MDRHSLSASTAAIGPNALWDWRSKSKAALSNTRIEIIP